MTKLAADKGGPQLDVCPFCGKKIADSSRAGSLTSFLFQANNCQCGVRSAQPDKVGQKDPSRTFCPRCGLQTATGNSLGSLTAFLFQDTRCKCPPESLTSAERDQAKQIYRSVELAPDVVIGGQYRIIKLIGSGGMGEVYLAQHLTLDKRCAIKLIPPAQVTDMGWQRFQIEAKSIAKLNHINLVKVTDFGIHEGCLPYYSMEFVDGETLAEMLGKKRTLALSVAIDVFTQICDGVDYAHRNGIVHRDLKPANIMLVTLPTGKLAVKILDFGLAKLTQDDRQKQSLTSVGDVFGSPFYMSPEQCVGGKIDNRSDIYSIGCTLFEALTGRPPFVGTTAVEIVAGHQEDDPPPLESLVGRNVLPPAMEVVLAKLLRKNPVERYQTLLELRGDLEKVARGEDVQPFYMSRSSHLRSQAGVEDLVGSGASNDEESSPVKPSSRSGLIVSLLVVGLLSLGAVTYIAAQKQSAKSVGYINKTKAETQIGLLGALDHPMVLVPGSDDAKAKDSFQKCGPIRSSLVEHDGSKKRRFVFPSWSIGRVVWDGLEHVTACGVVDVPADKPLTLEIGFKRSLEVLSNPEIFDKIAPGEFDNLLILGAGMGGDEASTLLAPMQTDNVVRILKKASRWSKLQYVSLNEVVVNKEVLDVLNAYKQLRFLTIFRPPEMNSKDLASQPFLGRLVKVALYRAQDIQPVCDRLSRSSELEALLLDGCDTSAQDLLQLNTCPRLHLVELHEDNVDRLVPAITQLTRLEEVRFMNTLLKPYQIKMITTCRNIRHLFLARKEYSAEEIRRCNLWEPKVTFEG